MRLNDTLRVYRLASRRALVGLVALGGLAPVQSAVAQGYCASANQSSQPTRLGAASNFSQGWNARTFKTAHQLPVTRLRDSLHWSRIETVPGQYTFDKAMTRYPDELARTGIKLTLTLNWGNPLYDEGHTPHSPEALAAFGRFAAAVVRRFPSVDTLEIGNEVNGANFVSGPVRTAGLARRGTYHLAMARAAADAVHAIRPDIPVLGGATHSLPAGFLWPLVKADSARSLDGLALHPYTTPIDQLPAQLALLCSPAFMTDLPLHVTEFASLSPGRAADELVMAYATLSALHAAEFDWYPLNARGDRRVPLITSEGKATDAGRAFRFVQTHLAPYPARDLRPDPFTRLYAFGRRAWVLWGRARSVKLTMPGVRVHDATGSELDPVELQLSPQAPMILLSEKDLDQAPIDLSCSTLLADSRLQFTYPIVGTSSHTSDPFLRQAEIGGARHDLLTMPGQERPGVPWNPYLGLPGQPRLRLDATSLLPAFGKTSGTLVQEFKVPADHPLHLDLDIAPMTKAAPGTRLVVRLGERVLAEQTIAGRLHLERALRTRTAAMLSVGVTAAASVKSVPLRYRIRISDPGRCPAAPVPDRPESPF